MPQIKCTMERKQSTNHATMNEISWNYNVKKAMLCENYCILRD